MSEVAARLDAIKDRIARAAEACGRAPGDVKLVAVSKTKPAAAIREVVQQTCIIIRGPASGYLADASRQEDGSWLITEHNCAILTVAHGFSQACSSELSFIRDALPGATVERVAHLMDGAHVCAYRITPAPTAPM